MKIKFTPSARNQFLTAVKYIQRDKPSAANNFRDKAEKILRRLEAFPDSGRTLPEFPELPYREVIVSSYRFFYKKRKTFSGLLLSGTAHKSPSDLNLDANYLLPVIV